MVGGAVVTALRERLSAAGIPVGPPLTPEQKADFERRIAEADAQPRTYGPKTTRLAEARVNDVTVALTEVDGRYLLTVHDGDDPDHIEVVDDHRAVAKNRYIRVRAQLQAGKTFAWLRSLVLIFQPAEEATT